MCIRSINLEIMRYVLRESQALCIFKHYSVTAFEWQKRTLYSDPQTAMLSETSYCARQLYAVTLITWDSVHVKANTRVHVLHKHEYLSVYTRKWKLHNQQRSEYFKRSNLYKTLNVSK